MPHPLEFFASLQLLGAPSRLRNTLVVLALMGLCTVVWGNAASGAGSTNAGADGANVLTPFQYVPAPKWVQPVIADELKRKPAHQKVFDAYLAGDYAGTAKLGRALMSQEAIDEQLQFYVANSLAWTGQLKPAADVYKALLSTKYKAQGQIGLANLARWQGRDFEASQMYSEVLRENPKDVDALDGARAAQRELRPRTIVTGGRTKDSSDVATRSLNAMHRWRSPTQLDVFEVEGGALGSENQRIDARQNDLTLRYKGLERPYKPQAELSTSGKTLYGNASAEFTALPLTLDVGRLDWGRATNNPNALANKLTANRVGVRGTLDTAWGNLFARADLYRVSDGNQVVTTAVRYTPSWRPLGPRFKPVFGVETRTVKFNTSNYWSPADGFGSFTGGVLGEWGGGDWSFYSSLQRGWPLFGEAGTGWSLSAAGKRWVTDDTAVGLNYWGMISKRDGAPYRARSLFATVEHIWP